MQAGDMQFVAEVEPTAQDDAARRVPALPMSPALASLSRQLAVRFAEGPRPTPQIAPPATPLETLLFGFEGRIGRARFWSIVALNVVVLAPVAKAAALADARWAGAVITLTLVLLAGACAWMILAASVKRLHDRDKSAWWLLLIAVPVAGLAWYLAECGLLSGTDGNNAYGSDPISNY